VGSMLRNGCKVLKRRQEIESFKTALPLLSQSGCEFRQRAKQESTRWRERLFVCLSGLLQTRSGREPNGIFAVRP
jgi:hypothetical protein